MLTAVLLGPLFWVAVGMTAERVLTLTAGPKAAALVRLFVTVAVLAAALATLK